MNSETKRAWLVRIGMAAIAVVFALLTLNSGGSVLFGSEEALQAAGDYVPFVVWFSSPVVLSETVKNNGQQEASDAR